MRQARAYTYRMDDFRLSRETIDLVGLPTWADRNVEWALQPRMFRPFSISIFHTDAEASVRARVASHPMVRAVEDVRVLYPNRAQVTLALRVPVARVAVWVDGKNRRQVRTWRLLSDDGCLLPRAPYRTYLERLPYRLPAVTGITERVPLNAGEVWEDRTERVKEAVAAAGLAARLYRDLRGRITLTMIDVSRFPASGENRVAGEVRLTISCPPTRRGGALIRRTVEWGRTERAREAVSREDDYSKKVARLQSALTSARPPAHIEVRWDLAAQGRTAP